MLRPLLKVVCAFILLAAVAIRVDAQSCPAPSEYNPYYSCATTGRCTAGETVSFFLLFPSYPTSPSCVSAVWTFSDGTAGATTAGHDSFTRTFPAGQRTVHVVITSGSQTGSKDVPVPVAHGLVGIRIVTPEITEGQPATFLISRTNADLSTDVPWRAFSQGSEPTSPYISPVQGIVTLNAGQLSAQLTLTTLQDSVFTGEKSYSVTIGPPPGVLSNDYLVGRDQLDTFSMLEDDWSLIDFTDRTLTVREDAGTATTAFQRSGNLDQGVDVRYTVSGQSITTVDELLHFAPGETVKPFTFPIAPNDGMWSGNRRAEISMNNFSRGAKSPYEHNNSPSIPLLILDDEPAPVVTVADVSIPELDSGIHNALVTFRVSTGTPFTPFELSWYTSPGTTDQADLRARDANMLFSPSTTEYTIPIEIMGDALYEPDETFILHLYQDLYTPRLPQLPADPIITILNDDPAIQPGSAVIDRGQAAPFSIDIGLAAASALALPVSASEPAVAAVPQTVNVGAGTSRASFEVAGVSPGASKVSVQLAGGKTLSANVTVLPAGIAIFQPASLTLFAGEEATVEISLSPPSVQTHHLALTIDNPQFASVSAMVTIPAGGSGTFTVTTIAPGVSHVSAALPAELGGGTVALPVNVNDPPETPMLLAIEPSSGAAAGGTPFNARGSRLTPDCRLLFGDTPATLFTLANGTTLLGTTPSHPRGVVDVTLVCDAARFVLKNAFTFVATRGRSVRH